MRCYANRFAYMTVSDENILILNNIDYITTHYVVPKSLINTSFTTIMYIR